MPAPVIPSHPSPPPRDPTPTSTPPTGIGRRLRVAGVLLALQVLAILAFSLYYVVELLRGEGTNPTQVLMSVVVFVLGAVLLGVLARGLFRGAGWARTPTVLWNVFMLLIAVSLAQSGQPLLTVAVVAVAGGGILAVLSARTISS